MVSPILFECIGEPTLADAILDRVLHSAHKIQLQGDSMRKRTGIRLKLPTRRHNSDPSVASRRTLGFGMGGQFALESVGNFSGMRSDEAFSTIHAEL